MTKQFAVYQIHLTADEIETINRTGSRNSVPKHAAKLDIQSASDETCTAQTDIAWDAGFYTHVANITASNLEDVFEIGNIGPEENIERLAKMHSISVADVIVDSSSKRHVVASFGFQALEQGK